MVTQTIKEKRSYETIAYMSTLSGCTPSIREWFTTIDLKHSVTVDNDRERRVKPPLRPMFLNEPTAQQLQYRLKSQTAKSSSEWIKTGTYCNNPVLRKYVYYKNPIEHCLYDVGGERTNWSGRLREELKDLRLNLGPSLVEYRETQRMFIGAVQKIRDIYRTVRGRSTIGRRKKRAPCRLAGAHLATTYGVMPLVSDLYESVERLTSVLDDPLFRRFSVYSSRNGRYQENNSGMSVDGYWKVSERATVYVQLLPAYGKFTLGNPAEWIWEATTLSFVIDWIIPIGTWLSSLDALEGVKDLKGTVTRKEEWGHWGEILEWASLTYPISSDRMMDCKYAGHSRSVIHEIPLPPLRWEPTESFRAVVNGVALMVGLGEQCKSNRKSNPLDWATYG